MQNLVTELRFIVNVMEARKKDLIKLNHNDQYSTEQRDQFAARVVELTRWQDAINKTLTKAGV